VAPTLRPLNRQWEQITSDLHYAPPSYNAFDRLVDTDTPLAFQPEHGRSLGDDRMEPRTGHADSNHLLAVLGLAALERPGLHRPAGDHDIAAPSHQAVVEAVTGADTGQLRVSLSGGREAVVDVVLALTGYRPDLSFLSELAVGIDPVTEGAAGLSRALSNITDCLAVPAVSSEDLDSGEPGFYLAGAKSYGRSRNFLLQSGYAQLATILERLSG